MVAGSCLVPVSVGLVVFEVVRRSAGRTELGRLGELELVMFLRLQRRLPLRSRWRTY